jgi:hypothetical protein
MLQTEFIPAVGNTHELQNQRFSSSKWFMGMASAINPRVNNGVTAQGFYVAGADGKGYAFNNNRSVDRVMSFMQTGMAKFKQDPPKTVEIASADVEAKFARGPDPSVSVLQVYSRIKPLPEVCDELNKGIGRDFLWVYPEEVKAIRETSKMPDTLAKRLVRFHLIDNVRGEPDMWKPGEVKSATFSLKALGKGGYSLNGSFGTATANNGRGVEGILEGELTLDPKEDRIVGFKAYAQTKAWGAGTYTPNPPPGKFGLVFAIVTATAPYAKDTPPAAALYGDREYRRPN